MVQLYIGYKNSQVERHVKDLKGFAKVHLEPGESKTVSIEINKQDLAYYCEGCGKWTVEDISYTAMIGASSACKDLLKADFNLK